MNLRAYYLSVALALGLDGALWAVEPEEGFVSMFNGKTLVGWVGNYAFWSVEDGAITGRLSKDRTTSSNTFLVWKGGGYSDFELRFSYRITAENDPGIARSGVQFRSRSLPPPGYVMVGYQADIEAGPADTGAINDEGGGAGGRGLLARRGEKVVWDGEGNKRVVGELGPAEELTRAIRKNDWNDYDIIVEGYHFVQKINGVTMVDVTDQSEKHVPRGIFGLKLAAGDPMTVQFKNLRLKKLERDRKIVLIAGPPSHGPGEHEHRAGCLLLAKCLNQVPHIKALVATNGWPSDASMLEDADAIAFYSDGGGGHPILRDDRLKTIGQLMKRGVGLGCIHYAVEVPTDHGGLEFLAWIGGYFETFYSVNPTWEAKFERLPSLPITQGVHPFTIRDEWYYHMRFLDTSGWLNYILSATPPDSTRGRPGANDSHGGNPEVQKHMGEPEHMMWTVMRPDTGRGFGFTGGHYHRNWGNDDFRKLVLNALVWIAQGEVPTNGVESVVTPADLEVNLDPKGR